MERKTGRMFCAQMRPVIGLLLGKHKCLAPHEEESNGIGRLWECHRCRGIFKIFIEINITKVIPLPMTWLASQQQRCMTYWVCSWYLTFVKNLVENICSISRKLRKSLLSHLLDSHIHEQDTKVLLWLRTILAFYQTENSWFTDQMFQMTSHHKSQYNILSH